MVSYMSGPNHTNQIHQQKVGKQQKNGISTGESGTLRNQQAEAAQKKRNLEKAPGDARCQGRVFWRAVILPYFRNRIMNMLFSTGMIANRKCVCTFLRCFDKRKGMRGKCQNKQHFWLRKFWLGHHVVHKDIQGKACSSNNADLL